MKGHSIESSDAGLPYLVRRLSLPPPRTDTSASAQSLTLSSGRMTSHQTNTGDEPNVCNNAIVCVQATEHQTTALGDRKLAQAVGDHVRRVATNLPEWLQPFTEGLTRKSSCSTDVTPAEVATPPPAKLTSNKAGGKHKNSLISRKTRIAKYANARKLQRRHAKN